MAERAEDVLELGEDDELDIELEQGPEDEDENGAAEEQDDGEEGDEPTDEEIPTFGEEAAPASEGDSSVIREMRLKLREKERQIAELTRGQQPQKVEVGPKPTLESCEYDEDRFEEALTTWKDRKAQAERQDREAQERTEAEQKAWATRVTAYEADKGRLAVSDFDAAESEVMATLTPQTQALIMLTEKPAALVYALSKAPAKLEELSKLDLARAAMMIGKLEDKVQMTKRSVPNPDRPVRGNRATTTADKELARLESKAERTGDRTELQRYRKKLKSRAN